jgi:hypothetical protein
MTLDEQRAKCIEAIKICHQTYEIGYFSDFHAARILDSLHGIARVDPIEATEEMLKAYCGALNIGGHGHVFPEKIKAAARWSAMSAAGDLTNPPEQKP